MKFCECRFAPNAETWRDAIRVGQRVIRRGGSVHEAFAPQAFRAAGVRASEVPILLDHDPTKRAGTVTVLIAHGDWHIASFVLDGPYAARAHEFIERGGGKVSLGFDDLETDPRSAIKTSPYHPATNWYTRARVNEISILPPGAIAWYQGAKVTNVSEFKLPTTPSSAATKRAVPAQNGTAVREIGRRRVGRDLVIDMSDGSQVIYHDAGWQLSRDPGRALGVR
jgi:phage head maturation protease